MMRREMLMMLLLITLISNFPANAEPVQVVYLSVGNGAYADPPAKTNFEHLVSFPDTPNGPWSARRVSYLFAAHGAVYGTELLGKQGKFITRQDVLDALKKTIKQAKQLTNPFIIYYYTGHGISESFGWNLFSVTGDYVGPYPFKDVAESANQLVYAGDIVDRLKKSGIPYLVLFDHCYEGEPQNLPEGLVMDVSDIIRFMNEFREIYPVLFSTKPGSSVPAVADPDPKVRDRAVGPLARRLLLAMQSFGNKQVPLRELIALMTDELKSKPLDNLTAPAITHVNMPLPNISFAPYSTPISAQRLYGSGKAAMMTGFSKPKAIAEQDVAPKTMQLRIEGVTNEYLTDGESYDLIAPSSAMTITTLEGKRGFELMFDGDNWGTIGFLTPGEKSIPIGQKIATTGSSFWDGNWGFDIGLNGRGCSESLGTIIIHNLQWEAGHWQNLDLDFNISCDGDKPFGGRLTLEW